MGLSVPSRPVPAGRFCCQMWSGSASNNIACDKIDQNDIYALCILYVRPTQSDTFASVSSVSVVVLNNYMSAHRIDFPLDGLSQVRSDNRTQNAYA